MYFNVVVQWGGVCWGLGVCVGDWEGDGGLGGEVLIKLSTISRLKSKSKNRPKNPFSTAVIFLEKKSCEIFLLEKIPIYFFRLFQDISFKFFKVTQSN